MYADFGFGLTAPPCFRSQDLALSSQECLSVFNRCGVHAICAAFLNLVSQLGPPPSLHQHVSQVKRQKKTLILYLF